MTRTLIMFLGRVAGGGRGYQLANYEFDEQTPEDAAAGYASLYETPYFGLALTRHLSNLGRHPDRVVVFGTSSSMWDAFLATMLGEDMSERDREELRQSAEAGAVTSDSLAAWQAAVQAAMAIQFGTQEIDLRILSSHLVTPDEQIGLVREMTEAVRDEDRIVLDVTHGFRHLPLLSCFAALTMRRIRRATIEGIYYGALEMRDAEGVSPVARLDGLLQIVDWLSAFEVSEATGDLSVFGPALRQAGAPQTIAENVRTAAFMQASGQFDLAAGALARAEEAIGHAEMQSPLTQVFRTEFYRRLAAMRKDSRYSRLRNVAFEALALERVNTAADFGLDAARERIKALYQNARQREHARPQQGDSTIDDFLIKSPRASRKAIRAFLRLRGMRNWLSHSGNISNPHKEVTSAMADVDKCLAALRHDLELLLPDNVQQRF